MKNFYSLLLLTFAMLLGNQAQSQPVSFEYDKTPPESGFRIEGYWVWCGSVIRVDSVYHLFASRWPKTGPFPEGYKIQFGDRPCHFEVAAGPLSFRGSRHRGKGQQLIGIPTWPTIPPSIRIGDEYVLFYIGSDFTTCQEHSTALLRTDRLCNSQIHLRSMDQVVTSLSSVRNPTIRPCLADREGGLN